MKATCIGARNHKIERIVFFNLDQFDIHVKIDQTDNSMINDKYVYTYNLKVETKTKILKYGCKLKVKQFR